MGGEAIFSMLKTCEDYKHRSRQESQTTRIRSENVSSRSPATKERRRYAVRRHEFRLKTHTYMCDCLPLSSRSSLTVGAKKRNLTHATVQVSLVVPLQRYAASCRSAPNELCLVPRLTIRNPPRKSCSLRVRQKLFLRRFCPWLQTPTTPNQTQPLTLTLEHSRVIFARMLCFVKVLRVLGRLGMCTDRLIRLIEPDLVAASWKCSNRLVGPLRRYTPPLKTPTTQPKRDYLLP